MNLWKLIFLQTQGNIAEVGSMLKFKRRSYLKKYMPKKSIKRSNKVWVLADWVTVGTLIFIQWKEKMTLKKFRRQCGQNFGYTTYK